MQQFDRIDFSFESIKLLMHPVDLRWLEREIRTARFFFL